MGVRRFEARQLTILIFKHFLQSRRTLLTPKMILRASLVNAHAITLCRTVWDCVGLDSTNSLLVIDLISPVNVITSSLLVAK